MAARELRRQPYGALSGGGAPLRRDRRFRSPSSLIVPRTSRLRTARSRWRKSYPSTTSAHTRSTRSASRGFKRVTSAGMNDLERSLALAHAANAVRHRPRLRQLAAAWGGLGDLARARENLRAGEEAAERLGDAIQLRWVRGSYLDVAYSPTMTISSCDGQPESSAARFDERAQDLLAVPLRDHVALVCKEAGPAPRDRPREVARGLDRR